MPQELLFTSVPAGLKPGTSGYCTVAKHASLDPLLERELERLSFYELMDDPSRPAVHAYRVINVQTGSFHVLSRIAYTGSDHTGRTNYLAHHLVFDQTEVYALQASPADLLLDPIGWLPEWPQGQAPRQYADGEGEKAPFCAGASPAPAQGTWANLTGQENNKYEFLYRTEWSFLQHGGDPTQPLNLISEFCALPEATPQWTWGALTFTTFLQPSDHGSAFRICGGSPDGPAAQLGRDTLHLANPPETCFQQAGSPVPGPLAPQYVPATQAETPLQEAAPTETVQDPHQPEPEQTYSEPIYEAEEYVSPYAQPAPAAGQRKGPANPTKAQIAGSTRRPFPQASATVAKKPAKKKLLMPILILLVGMACVAAASFFTWKSLAKDGIPGDEDVQASTNHDAESNPNPLLPENNDSNSPNASDGTLTKGNDDSNASPSTGNSHEANVSSLKASDPTPEVAVQDNRLKSWEGFVNEVRLNPVRGHLIFEFVNTIEVPSDAKELKFILKDNDKTHLKFGKSNSSNLDSVVGLRYKTGSEIIFKFIKDGIPEILINDFQLNANTSIRVMEDGDGKSFTLVDYKKLFDIMRKIKGKNDGIPSKLGEELKALSKSEVKTFEQFMDKETIELLNKDNIVNIDSIENVPFFKGKKIGKKDLNHTTVETYLKKVRIQALERNLTEKAKFISNKKNKFLEGRKRYITILKKAKKINSDDHKSPSVQSDVLELYWYLVLRKELIDIYNSEIGKKELEVSLKNNPEILTIETTGAQNTVTGINFDLSKLPMPKMPNTLEKSQIEKKKDEVRTNFKSIIQSNYNRIQEVKNNLDEITILDITLEDHDIKTVEHYEILSKLIKEFKKIVPSEFNKSKKIKYRYTRKESNKTLLSIELSNNP